MAASQRARFCCQKKLHDMARFANAPAPAPYFFMKKRYLFPVNGDLRTLAGERMSIWLGHDVWMCHDRGSCGVQEGKQAAAAGAQMAPTSCRLLSKGTGYERVPTSSLFLPKKPRCRPPSNAAQVFPPLWPGQCRVLAFVSRYQSTNPLACTDMSLNRDVPYTHGFIVLPSAISPRLLQQCCAIPYP